ncbi:hypothetical protein M427DRAFT_33766 [Gonapodya prolifera JEL478]|uniref:Uncharacterized protein n=1 Tax=Gonapodya prolifera (strain JEL478) TaxID=1344416 RepID=A0A139AA55_GONPJ|nr:hypothetical protein M427DRAFT_33766 [Gonapodya prolifera JEL478]|eukprot:KXS13569.1 hypothetical protein M427DRAFT_33766 [Gonapodya prolifera JEL478]
MEVVDRTPGRIKSGEYGRDANLQQLAKGHATVMDVRNPRMMMMNQLHSPPPHPMIKEVQLHSRTLATPSERVVGRSAIPIWDTVLPRLLGKEATILALAFALAQNRIPVHSAGDPPIAHPARRTSTFAMRGATLAVVALVGAVALARNAQAGTTLTGGVCTTDSDCSNNNYYDIDQNSDVSRYMESSAPLSPGSRPLTLSPNVIFFSALKCDDHENSNSNNQHDHQNSNRNNKHDDQNSNSDHDYDHEDSNRNHKHDHQNSNRNHQHDHKDSNPDHVTDAHINRDYIGDTYDVRYDVRDSHNLRYHVGDTHDVRYHIRDPYNYREHHRDSDDD